MRRRRRLMGPVEFLVIFALAVLLFGGGKNPPGLMNRLREGLRNFWGGGPGGPAAA